MTLTSLILSTIILLAFSFLLLAIGWLLTGKSKLKKRCGTNPKEDCILGCKKNKHCDDQSQ